MSHRACLINERYGGAIPTAVVRSTVLATTVALILLILTGLVMRAMAQTGPEIEVRVPEPGEILEDNGAITTTLVLTCENVYGYQFVVTFDPQLLQADGAGFDDSFISPDYTPPLWSATIDNGAGTVRFAASQVRPALPVTGTGVIGWVRFVGQSAPTLPATATVGIHEPLLATRDGEPMTPTVISGTIRILPKAVITGEVELQGRSDWSGAVVTAVQAAVTCTTDATGWYTLTVAAGTYGVTVEMARYLDAEREVIAVRGANPLPRVKLLGGDANDDDEVDIVDASIIGGKYGLVVDPLTERADINADGVVDISDCTITGGNYTRTSPVPWP
ncbi:MAG: carboxypeptidase regulatory-like domain-containing protein [Chloroflexi bacterium]|nr:carboxypeptidase regulatory-like domain-containing protein [Chloroflexota bacterium]